jgi:hypothetical protein
MISYLMFHMEWYLYEAHRNSVISHLTLRRPNIIYNVV